jgi:hypothetical protein
MEWFWLIQLMLNLAFGVVLWHLWVGRRADEAQRREMMHESLSREDFEQYQQAMGDLCEQLQRESEKWNFRLEDQARQCRELMQQMQERTRQADGKKEQKVVVDQPRTSAGVGALYAADTSPAKEDTVVDESVPGKATRVDEQVRDLFRQGCSVDQIARRLHLGQREVQLLLNFRR